MKGPAQTIHSVAFSKFGVTLCGVFVLSELKKNVYGNKPYQIAHQRLQKQVNYF